MTTKLMHLDAKSVADAIDGSIKSANTNPNTRTVTASTTLVASDAGGTVVVNDASASNVTIPANVFVAGQMVRIVNAGVGKATFVAGASMTITTAAAGQILDTHAVGSVFFTSPTTAVTTGGAVS